MKEIVERIIRAERTIGDFYGEASKFFAIEFYKTAVKKRQDLRWRFLFFTEDDATDVIVFLKKNKLRYLIRPVHISEIREEVVRIIDRRRA